MSLSTDLLERSDDEGRGPRMNAILNALAVPVFVVDDSDRLAYVNAAAEEFFASGSLTLLSQPLGDLLAADSPIVALAGQVRRGNHSVTEHGMTLESPRIGVHLAAVDAAPVAEQPGHVVFVLRLEPLAGKLDQRLSHRSAARSVTGMAAMLAHELKNPLSGIKGAAQLLEDQVSEPDRELTQLICGETDRIVALVDRMATFAQDGPISRGRVNLHEVLEHVRKLAQTGFARHLRISEDYDPSLPAAHGNRDLLIQAILNLVKNASEAAPREGGEILLSTTYRHGVRLAVPGSERRVELPLCIGVRDNGSGIPDELRAHLFDPFITTKSSGKGLGLALVAKVVEDHGGIIEVRSEPRRTEFRLLLPVAPHGAGAP